MVQQRAWGEGEGEEVGGERKRKVEEGERADPEMSFADKH